MYTCPHTHGSGEWCGLEGCLIYCVQGNTRNARLARKSREVTSPAVGRRANPDVSEKDGTLQPAYYHLDLRPLVGPATCTYDTWTDVGDDGVKITGKSCSLLRNCEMSSNCGAASLSNKPSLTILSSTRMCAVQARPGSNSYICERLSWRVRQANFQNRARACRGCLFVQTKVHTIPYYRI